MIKSFSVAAVLLSVTSNFALANDGMYVSGFVGKTFSSNLHYKLPPEVQYFDDNGNAVDYVGKEKLKTATPLGLAVGYNLGDVSLDLSYTKLSSKFKSDESVSLKNHFVLANAYYNFNKLHSVVKPYIGGGLGVNLIQDSKNALAYQGVIGSKFAVSKALDLFVDYRYTATRNIVDDSDSMRIRYNSINLGITYSFGAKEEMNSVFSKTEDKVKEALISKKTKDNAKSEDSAEKAITTNGINECLKNNGYAYVLNNSYSPEEQKFFYTLLSKEGKCSK